ncbi:hypothetical protein [Parapedobacter sp. 10938]|uniref:hypothetical protein n=1 Tax=Parapedobacter flavus TaxID=3110225 RepID=UPI002DBC9575|nr:hypothetical protein [Parapedobacter sp. 10938]MEC3881842.1 hypothetical protein [Parapedobacter sp. 10938]
METAYFKRRQAGKLYNYFKVVGGPGKTQNGYQEVVSFLNDKPLIFVEHNLPYNPLYPDRPFELLGTWDIYEVGLPISKEEYEDAYRMATSNDFNLH